MYSILFKIDNEVMLDERKELNNPTAEVFVLAVKARDIISSYLGDFPFKDLNKKNIEDYVSYLKENIDLERINHPEISDVDDLEFAANINIHGLFSLNHFLEEIMEEHGLDFWDYNQANIYMNGETMQISVYFELFHHNKRFVLDIGRITQSKIHDLSCEEIKNMKLDEIIHYISEYLTDAKRYNSLYDKSYLMDLKTNLSIWSKENLPYSEFVLDYMNNYLESLKNNKEE